MFVYLSYSWELRQVNILNLEIISKNFQFTSHISVKGETVDYLGRTGHSLSFDSLSADSLSFDNLSFDCLSFDSLSFDSLSFKSLSFDIISQLGDSQYELRLFFNRHRSFTEKTIFGGLVGH